MNKKIILVIGLLILLAGGVLAWQYFVIPKEKVNVPKEELVSPLLIPEPTPTLTTTVRIPVINPMGAGDFGDRVKWDQNIMRRAYKTGEYIGCGDSIAFIEKEIKHTLTPLTAIYQILFAENEITEGTKYINPITPIAKGRTLKREDGSSKIFKLQFERVVIKDNIATVYLTGDYLSVGSCDPPQVEAVLKFAAKQFPWIKDVEIFIKEQEAIFVHGGRDDVPLWGPTYCTPLNPCKISEGDCDTDADCGSGLFCAQNVGEKYGQRATMDVCEARGR